jgi:endonuclease YncB( thermonuclease family)
MVRLRSSLTQIVALSAWLAVPQGWAADRKEWVMLTNCQQVAHADNDGDSFRVRCGAKEFSLRLYFVDAPETNLRYPERTREQSEYFGVTLDETMRGGGAARDLVRDTLRDPFTVWTRWAMAAGRSTEPRYYAMLLIGTNRLDEILIRKGLAQPKGVRPNLPTGEKATAHLERLRVLEADAKKERVGLWARSTEKKAATVRP